MDDESNREIMCSYARVGKPRRHFRKLFIAGLVGLAGVLTNESCMSRISGEKPEALAARGLPTWQAVYRSSSSQGIYFAEIRASACGEQYLLDYVVLPKTISHRSRDGTVVLTHRHHDSSAFFREDVVFSK